MSNIPPAARPAQGSVVRTRLHLHPLATVPLPAQTEALMLAVRVALGERSPAVPVQAPAWRFAGRPWPLRSTTPVGHSRGPLVPRLPD